MKLILLLLCFSSAHGRDLSAKIEVKSGRQECPPHTYYFFFSRKYAAVSTTMYTAPLINVR